MATTNRVRVPPPAQGAPSGRLPSALTAIYGPVAPAPAFVVGRVLHRAVVARWGDATLDTVRVAWDDRANGGFTMQLMRPAEAQHPRCPVLISGDACWPYLPDEVIAKAASIGVALAWFNRTEVAADPPGDDRDAVEGAAAHAGPHGMAALAAWAWALGRAVDALSRTPRIDARGIAVIGHSRGGKAALLAGAIDGRIALTAATNPGTLGAASSIVAGPGSESVADLVKRFAHWVGPTLRAAVASGKAQPEVDQHALLSMIAPRRLLVIQARDDAWANPQGTLHAMTEAHKAFARHGAADAMKLLWRNGGHVQSVADWRTVLEATRLLARAS